MIRRALITTLFILYTICCFGQTAHVRAFTYDTNGNRIASEMLFAKTRTDGSVDKEEFLYSATDTLSNMTVRIYPNPTNDMFFVSTAVSEADVTMKATLVSATTGTRNATTSASRAAAPPTLTVRLSSPATSTATGTRMLYSMNPTWTTTNPT